MKTVFAFMFAAIFLIVVSAASAQQDALTKEYHRALAKYFEISDELIGEMAKMELPSEEMPIILYLAAKAKKPPLEIANQRAEGDNWMKITGDIGLSAEAYYMLIAGQIKSTTYKPIFATFNDTPKGKWKDIQFSDEDVLNIVNLRFISSHHDFSVFDIMTMRDKGHNFIKINNIVRLANEEKYRKEKLEKREAAKAKKEAEDQ